MGQNTGLRWVKCHCRLSGRTSTLFVLRTPNCDRPTAAIASYSDFLQIPKKPAPPTARPTPKGMPTVSEDTVFPAARLFALTALAIAIHGYHLGADDAAIYIPAIKRAADPSLYPFGDAFFLSHAHLSLFPNLIGGSARLAHLPVDTVILAWHAFGIFLLLTAAWQFLGLCFRNSHARWCGVALLAATLSVPVAGTALAIMDPYLTARSLSTPATLFAVTAWFGGRRLHALFWLAAAAAVHPQMAAYGAALFACDALVRYSVRLRWREPAWGMAAALPFALDFAPVSGPARACLLSRAFFFVSTWTWYEWLGVFAPLLLLAWWRRSAPRNTLPAFTGIAGALLPFGVLSTAIALVFDLFLRLESYARLQPMRSFHLLYVIFFLLLGGVVGEYALRARPLRWALLFVPIACGMLLVDRAAYPASSHLEWPGAAGRNSWLSAFLWVRTHTPKNAVFALDPAYMSARGEDAHGFRAVAERSVLADAVKDSGAVSLFPRLAAEWSREVAATQGLNSFTLSDYRTLATRYPVTWILTDHVPAGLTCPYDDGTLAVCRL